MTSDNNDVKLYNTKEIMSIFRCSRQRAYEMMNAPGFPSFRINSKYFVEKNTLEKWIDKNAGRKVRT